MTQGTNATTDGWLQISTAGFAALNQSRPPEHLVKELVQNALDAVQDGGGTVALTVRTRALLLTPAIVSSYMSDARPVISKSLSITNWPVQVPSTCSLSTDSASAIAVPSEL